KPSARLNPIEIAVNIELQQHRWMIRRPTGRFGIDPAKAKLAQIELLDKDVNHPNRIVLADPVFQAFRKQRALPAIRARNKALHPTPPQITQESYRENQMKQRVFTQARSKADVAAPVCDVSYSPGIRHRLSGYGIHYPGSAVVQDHENHLPRAPPTAELRRLHP